jgi:hypothetical protein
VQRPGGYGPVHDRPAGIRVLLAAQLSGWVSGRVLGEDERVADMRACEEVGPVRVGGGGRVWDELRVAARKERCG